jgi:hypothetical protein
LTPTSQQLARALILRGCGISDGVVEVQPENTSNPLPLQDKHAAGIFDDFHRMEVNSLRAEVAFIRSLNADLEGDKRELRTRLQCACWLALLLAGLLFCALRWPGCGGSSRSYVAGPAVRRLAPLECTRLQGFPDDYFAGMKLADGPIYKMLGNSMAVPVIAWIGRMIESQL